MTPGLRPMPPSLLDLPDTSPAALPPAILVPPLARPIRATIRPPGSKSLTNRAILLAALAKGRSTLRGALTDADDAQVMLRAVAQLGARVEQPDADTLCITGVAGQWPIAEGQAVTLDLHNAGTATRFLAAAAILARPGSAGIIIDGDARMRQRPIAELLAALNNLADAGPKAESLHDNNLPPIRVPPMPLDWISGMAQAFGRTQSSQFISAVLLIAPFLPHGLSITFTTPDITSRAYVDMTIALLRRLGVRVSGEPATGITVAPAPLDSALNRPVLPAFDYTVEPDASGATYFTAAAALVPGSSVTIDHLNARPGRSLQGDASFTRVLEEMGARAEQHEHALTIHAPPDAHLRPGVFDLRDMPDTAMTAAVLACFASPTPDNPRATSDLLGLRTLRVKETDRLAALQTELTKLGAGVEIITTRQDEALRITPPMDLVHTPLCAAARPSEAPPPVVFGTYHDHRMAMALALVGLRARRAIVINDPACVRKTYPEFWRDLRTLYA
jgi:3-phosphoshikimate 1-carboxyvinyltransferase